MKGKDIELRKFLFYQRDLPSVPSIVEKVFL